MIWTLAKINYRIHTDAIRTHLIPAEVTARQWRPANSGQKFRGCPEEAWLLASNRKIGKFDVRTL